MQEEEEWNNCTIQTIILLLYQSFLRFPKHKVFIQHTNTFAPKTWHKLIHFFKHFATLNAFNFPLTNLQITHTRSTFSLPQSSIHLSRNHSISLTHPYHFNSKSSITITIPQNTKEFCITKNSLDFFIIALFHRMDIKEASSVKLDQLKGTGWVVMYPSYIDSSMSVKDGRKVRADLSCMLFIVSIWFQVKTPQSRTWPRLVCN